MAMMIYPIGTLAYFDSFSGLIKCKVIGHGECGEVRIRITVSKGAYVKREIIEYPNLWIVPRDRVFIRSGQYRIKAGGWKYDTQDSN